MNQKTAMMELIDYMKANFHLTDESLETFDKLLEKEKEQIKKSFRSGIASLVIEPRIEYTKTSDKYYNETYKQD